MNDGAKGLAKGLLIFGIIIIILYVLGNDDSKSKCYRSGCNNNQASGSSYCYLHKPSTGRSSYSRSGSSSSSSGRSSGSSSSSSTASNNTTNKYSSGSKTYNSLNCDPHDYDSPEDYADDAWGDDFDDWDDAYDFWENY